MAKGLGKVFILIRLAGRHARATLHLRGAGTTNARANESDFLHSFNIASKEPEVKNRSQEPKKPRNQKIRPLT
jgi:hypothetical protein